ncbi:SufE family protein [Salinimonas marina]|uniref:SufE family protein n=1 Tax=Salinimonas marina TaxID=2785918 RepID=A0A7S9DVC0_9ALTE|nr:SufE family protein [Salinimonas marina]QPG04530.1 SufE family protein [Salinimonas marina]
MSEALLPIARQVKAAGSWDELTRQLMLAAKTLPAMPAQLKVEANQVRGCQSKVWLAYNPVLSPAFQGYSEAKIIRGVLTVLLEKANDLSGSQRPAYDYTGYLTRLGISRNISQSRADGVAQIIRRLHELAC